MEVIQDIRQKYHVDSVTQLFLRETLERGVNALAGELYSTNTHFILEFVQNADDNRYPPNVTPTLTMRVEDHAMSITSNETGFTEANVRAICNIGKSTKQNQTGFIGEKGIGFKSVFKVADIIHISSGCFTFHFDRNTTLGMLAPIWDRGVVATPGQTVFRLELRPTESGSSPGAELSLQIREIKPSLLLFLRTLRTMTFVIMGVVTTFSREDVEQSIVKLTRQEGDSPSRHDFYFVVKHAANMAQVVETKREGIQTSEVILAFPINHRDNHTPRITGSQDVHAFLPLRPMGFQFIVQADFLTSSSREDILQNTWNTVLVANVANTFVHTVDLFLSDYYLRHTWMLFLPLQQPLGVFAGLKIKLLQRLSEKPILADTNDTWRRPSQLLIVPSQYCDDQRKPLIPTDFLPGCYYISCKYNLDQVGPILRELGAADMSPDVFLDALGKMDFSVQSNSWRESVCRLLKSHPRGRWSRFDHRILQLRLLPLQNGRWGYARDASTYVFDLELANVPADVELGHVSSIVGFHERSLFKELGVRDADPVHVAHEILKLQAGVDSLSNSLQHINFFFHHRHHRNFPSAQGFRLFSQNSRRSSFLATELYMDTPDLRRYLNGTSAHFVNSKYVEGEYTQEKADWLASQVGLQTCPRVLNGKLSIEFREMIHTLSTIELLLALRGFWPTVGPKLHTSALTEISEVVLQSNHGWHPLSSMMLDRQRLRAHVHARVQLPIVPVSDPESSAWDFLGRLGVLVEVNVHLFVRLLVELQAADIKGRATVMEVYRQLDARFTEDPSAIRDAFQTSPLFFVPSSDGRFWFKASSIVWRGPPSMRSKVALNFHYPSLESLFVQRLSIGDAEPSIIVDELMAFKDLYAGQILDEDALNRARALFADLASSLAPQKPPVGGLKRLLHAAAFPTTKGDGHRLRSLEDFYLPSCKPRFRVLQGRVPLFDLPGLSLSVAYKMFAHATFQDSVKFLEKEAVVDCTPVGEQLLNSERTTVYASRFSYIERDVERSIGPKKLSHTQAAVLKKMEDMSVIDVKALRSSWSLGDIKAESMDDLVLVEETESSIKVFVSRDRCREDAGCKVDLEICQQLATLLSVPTRTLLYTVSVPIEVLESLALYERLDNPHGELGDEPKTSQYDPTTATVTSAITVRSQPSQRPGIRRALLPSNFNRSSESSQDALATTLRVAIDSLEGILLGTGAVYNSVAHSPRLDIDTLSHQITPNTFSLGRSGSSSAPGTASSQVGSSTSGLFAAFSSMSISSSMPSTGPSDDQVVTGIVGEYLAYKLLSSICPTFTENHWTSELRGKVEGFSPFEGTASTDFTYTDYDGVLSKLWLSSEALQELGGRVATFHIEVKSTSGVRHTPFHISPPQMRTMIELTARPDAPSTNIYVLLHFWGVRGKTPQHAVYVDPWACLCNKTLAFSSTVEMMSAV